MKFGMRKPSVNKMIKARTTTQYKKNLKRTVNPLYSKKGMGLLSPKKAAYNKVYNKTSFSWFDLFK